MSLVAFSVLVFGAEFIHFARELFFVVIDLAGVRFALVDLLIAL
jgi:hypothetical protein